MIDGEAWEVIPVETFGETIATGPRTIKSDEDGRSDLGKWNADYLLRGFSLQTRRISRGTPVIDGSAWSNIDTNNCSRLMQSPCGEVFY